MMDAMNNVLRARALPALTEFEVAECHQCYELTRAEHAARIVVEQRELTVLIEDLHRDRLPNERMIWGYPRVRAVMAGPFGPQAEEIIRAHFRRKAGGRNADVLD